MSKDKWLVEFIRATESNGESAAGFLQRVLNRMEESGFDPTVLDRDNGFFVIGKRVETDADQTQRALQGLLPLDKLRDLLLDFRCGSDPGFVLAAMGQVSSPDIDVARRELPDIIAKMVKGMPMPQLHELRKDCAKFAAEHDHDGAPCILGQIGAIISTTLQQQITINLQ